MWRIRYICICKFFLSMKRIARLMVWGFMSGWIFAADPSYSKFRRNHVQSADRKDCWNPALPYPTNPIPSQWHHSQEVDFTIWCLPLLGNICWGEHFTFKTKIISPSIRLCLLKCFSKRFSPAAGTGGDCLLPHIASRHLEPTQVHPCAKQVIRAFFNFWIHELNL